MWSPCRRPTCKEQVIQEDLCEAGIKKLAERSSDICHRSSPNFVGGTSRSITTALHINKMLVERTCRPKAGSINVDIAKPHINRSCPVQVCFTSCIKRRYGTVLNPTGEIAEGSTTYLAAICEEV